MKKNSRLHEKEFESVTIKKKGDIIQPQLFKYDKKLLHMRGEYKELSICLVDHKHIRSGVLLIKNNQNITDNGI